MKIIYETPEEAEKLTIDSVEDDQFFVWTNRLCQKVTNGMVNIITDSSGTLFADQARVSGKETIDRIIPNVKKIEY